MKEGIHPTWYKDAKVACDCGEKLTVGATVPEIHVEICGACHPFYTGQEKLIDTAGRVETFERRQAEAVKAAEKQGGKKKKVAAEKKPDQPKSLKEMLKRAQS